MREEILHKHISKECMDELSENVWPDMLDAMEEYAKYYHEQQSKWISVEERLPEKDVEVMCYSLSMGIVSDRYVRDVGNEHFFYGDREKYLTDVTHWMPLPKQPKP